MFDPSRTVLVQHPGNPFIRQRTFLTPYRESRPCWRRAGAIGFGSRLNSTALSSQVWVAQAGRSDGALNDDRRTHVTNKAWLPRLPLIGRCHLSSLSPMTHRQSCTNFETRNRVRCAINGQIAAGVGSNESALAITESLQVSPKRSRRKR